MDWIGYGDFGATAEMFIEWEVSAPAEVDANLKFRYANQYNNHPMEVLVNGESAKSLLDFPDEDNIERFSLCVMEQGVSASWLDGDLQNCAECNCTYLL